MDTDKVEEYREMKPNDPIYQTVPSNTPEPWNNKKMFGPDGDQLEETEQVAGHTVKIRYALCKKRSKENKRWNKSWKS